MKHDKVVQIVEIGTSTVEFDASTVVNLFDAQSLKTYTSPFAR